MGYSTLWPKGSIAAERKHYGRKKALRQKYRRAEVVAAATEKVLRPQDAAAIVTAWLTLVHYFETSLVGSIVQGQEYLL